MHPFTFEHLPKRKLEGLLAEGYEINGYSFQRTYPDGSVKRGAITTGGMVLWWNDPHPVVSIKSSVSADVDPCPGCKPGHTCRTPSCGRLSKVTMSNVLKANDRLDRSIAQYQASEVEARLSHEPVWTEKARQELVTALQPFFDKNKQIVEEGVHTGPDGHRYLISRITPKGEDEFA